MASLTPTARKSALMVLVVLGVADWAAINFVVAPQYVEELNGATSATGPPEPLVVATQRPPTAPLTAASPAPATSERKPSSAAAPREPAAVAIAPAPEPLQFATNSARLDAKATRILAEVGREMRKNPALSVSLSGHTDGRGSSDYNALLSKRRAEVAANYLTTVLGIASSRVSTSAFGADRPVDPATTQEAFAKNRRVEIVWK